MFETDITDCYGSIYTHSLAWALHEKEVVKQNRSLELIGNQIDRNLCQINCMQTNGIPQGSVLMDIIAELLLLYADMKISSAITITIPTSNFKILRYRDDYRVFVNSPIEGRSIIKTISDVLASLGLHLSTRKTKFTDEIITNSIKSGKLDWLATRNCYRLESLEKNLLIIHKHASLYPNSGSLMKPLKDFRNRIENKTNFTSRDALISIVTDIARRNPRTHPECMSIISAILYPDITHQDRKGLIEKIWKRLKEVPNIGYLEIWLQRILEPLKCKKKSYGDHNIDIKLNEKICEAVIDPNCPENIWDNEFLENKTIASMINIQECINRETIKQLDPKIEIEETELFASTLQYI